MLSEEHVRLIESRKEHPRCSGVAQKGASFLPSFLPTSFFLPPLLSFFLPKDEDLHVNEKEQGTDFLQLWTGVRGSET